VDADYLKDVADLVLRFLHVVAGIAWIGASFYFIRLDLGLSSPRERADIDQGVAGEYWGVHGGGFYHSQKYLLAPRVLPEPLHWFKWEAYTTWLSGFALLVLLYWADADTRLIDPAVADLSAWEAIAASAGLLLGGWLIYDAACRLLRDDLSVAVTTALLVVGVAWVSGELFTARAAYLQVGAVLGTIMAANVFLVIIPAHRELVRAKEEGREPDPAPGLRAKQRSVHNNYLTLPVVFTMLAGHAPLTFGSDHAWLVLLAIFAILVVVRHFFNLMHRGRMPLWLLGAAAAGAVALMFALEPNNEPVSLPAGGFLGDEPAEQVVVDRCQSCHAGASAPLGVRLETFDQMTQRADDIARQVESRAMPPGNVTGMTDDERLLLIAWAEAQR
jgi:uncharacterized membrane protein